jgi:SAM-dependent methyltransferase
MSSALPTASPPWRGTGGTDPLPLDDLLAGTTEHFADPVLYDHEYRRRRADLTWYRRLAASAGAGPILEIGCGTGRVLVPLLRDGRGVVGVDLSAPMLGRAAGRCRRLGRPARSRAALLRADMRHLPIAAGRVVLVIAPFHVLQHLYHPDALLATLAGVRRALAPGGRFAFDVTNPDVRWLARRPDLRAGRARFRDPRDGRRWLYSTTVAYDAARQIAHVRIHYDPVDAPHAAPRVVRLAHRMFFPRELEALLALGGFRIESRRGGFRDEPWSGDAAEQVCTAVPAT